MRRPCYLTLLFLLGISFAAPAADDKGTASPTPIDFSVAVGGEVSLDPSLMADDASINVGLGLFEGLMQFDPKTNKGVPGMASSYTVSPDGLSVTFKLRKAQWSDGRPVRAEDFVYAMRRILAPKTGAAYAYLPALVIRGAADYNAGKTADFSTVGIKALDARTLRYSLVGPTPYFADMTANSAFWPLPEWAVERSGDDWTKPANIVTNGPYILKEWEPREYAVLAKNGRYWDAGNVRLRGIKVLLSEDLAANYELYKSGAVDWMRGIVNGRIDEFKRRPDYQSSARVATYYYEFNVTRKPVDNVLVRRALAAAIDKGALVDKVLKGGQIPADSMVPPMAGYSPQKGVGYDIEAARKYLAEAGYPDGKGFPTLTIVYNTNEGHKAIAEYVQRQWKRNLNIEVELKNMDFRSLIELRTKSHGFTVARAGWVGDYLDPNTYLDMFITGGDDNDSLYADPDYDKLVRDAAGASGADRMKMLQEAENILLARDQVTIPFYFYANQDLIDTSTWGGWNATPLGFHPFKYLYKK